jgi:hypothetical protein
VKKSWAAGVVTLALWVAIATALLMILAAAGTHLNLLSWRVGHDLLAIRIGGVAAHVAGALAVLALIVSFFDLKRLGMGALIAVVVAGVTLGGFVRYITTSHHAPPVHEVSTNWDEPVGFSPELLQLRGDAPNKVEDDPRVPADVGPPWGGMRVADVNAKTCPGAKAIPHGVDPDKVAKALQAEHAQVVGQAVFRVEAMRTGLWFGATDDIAVRIRPERTDIRAVRRAGLFDHGDNCGLVTRLVQALS